MQRSTSRLGPVSLLSVTLACALAGDAGALDIFRSEQGRFHVLLPDAPSVRSHSQRTLLGRVRHLVYEVEAEDASWAVEIHDIPRGATFVMSSETILDRARKGFLEDEDRTELERTEVVRRGHPAQRIRYVRPDAPDTSYLALLLLVGNRIYIAIGEDSPAARKVLPPERFLASFDFWKEGSPPPAHHRAPGAEPILAGGSG